MDKETADRKIKEAAKTIFSYCLTRTNSKEEAEDLSQDILLEIIRSHENIRDDRAFYGFMWAVAGNVYKNWCKKRLKRETELDENMPDSMPCIEEELENESDIILLRRELCLLSGKYRKAAILYYFNGLSVPSISEQLQTSESMVKYLLFKARKILKEGMNMERNYGEQSYNPKQLTLMYMGEGPNRFWGITNGKKIPQNILWACYNDSLSEEEISLQIGIPLPYLEPELKILTDAGLLIKKGNKLSTDIIINTKELKNEIASKTADYQEAVADKLCDFINKNEYEIRNIGFYGNTMSRNTFLWQITCFALYLLFGKITEKYTVQQSPVTAFGDRAYVWGDEEPVDIFNFCNMSKDDGCLTEGELHFMDWLQNPKSDNNDFYRNLKLANFFVKLASDKVENPNEYEKEMLAELIRKGYAINNNGSMAVTSFVYTRGEYQALHDMLMPVIDELMITAGKIKEIEEKTMLNHVPSHLNKQVGPISCMRMFDDVICASAQIMHRKDFLKTSWNANEMPTVFVVFDK